MCICIDYLSPPPEVEGMLKLVSNEMEEIPVSLRKETVFA
jgi:hypothetical protein